jgi:prolipoprotein diacylglyceryl transferase
MEPAADSSDALVFDLDPIILDFRTDLGIDWLPLQLRYYGIIFAAMLYIGFVIWRWQMLRGGFAPDVADRFLLWAVVAVIVGSRLGHCLFYDPVHYLSHPLEMLKFWKGGLASHGATIGLVLLLFIYGRWYKFPFTEALDRFAMSTCVGAAAVRLGNFLNSEIVGRATDMPWAVKFPRHDCMQLNLCGVFHLDDPESSPRYAALIERTAARHPSQLYEFALGLLALLACYVADRLAGKEKRPLGILGGVFFTSYFGGRFFVEFFKEYQTLDDSFLTMGQYLSIIPVLFGVGLLLYARVKHIPTCDLRPPPPPEIPAEDDAPHEDDAPKEQ